MSQHEKIRKIRAQKAVEQGHRCYWCGEVFGMGDLRVTADHVIEKAIGGSKIDPSNIVAAHRICNSKRSEKLGTMMNPNQKAKP